MAVEEKQVRPALLWSSWGGEPESRAARVGRPQLSHPVPIRFSKEALTSSEVVALSTSQDSSGHLTPLKTGPTAWAGGETGMRRFKASESRTLLLGVNWELTCTKPLPATLLDCG